MSVPTDRIIETHAPPSSQPYRFYVLMLLLGANTLSYADRHLFSILIPAIKQEFGSSDSLMGLIGGPAFILSYVLLSMPLARLADRWSRRRVLALAATLWSLATAASGAAASVTQLALSRVMVGVGEAGGMPPAQAMIADLYDERHRSGALGVLASSNYFGLILGLLGGATIASVWGWRAAFFALALPGVPIALLIWLTGPRRVRNPNIEVPRGDTLATTIRRCWAIPSFRLLALGVGVYNIFGYAGAIWMPAFFMRSHGMTVVEAGAWLSMGAAVGGIAGSMAAGVIVDKLRVRDERWQLRVPAIGYFISFPLFLVMFTLAGGAALTLGEVRIPVVAMLGMVTGFLGSLWAGPSYGAAARLVAPERRAQATALLVVIVNIIGSTLGPLMAGLVSDLLTARFAIEALRLSLLSMSVLVLAGGMLFWRASVHYPLDLQRARNM